MVPRSGLEPPTHGFSDIESPAIHAHPDQVTDLAGMRIQLGKQQSDGAILGAFRSESELVSLKEMQQGGVAEGDFVYSLAYSLGLVDEVCNKTPTRLGNR